MMWYKCEHLQDVKKDDSPIGFAYCNLKQDYCKRGKCEDIQRFSFRTVEKVPGIYDDTAEKIFFLNLFVDIGALIDLLNQFDNVNIELSNMLKKYEVYAERLKAKNLMLENIIERNKCYLEEGE